MNYFSIWWLAIRPKTLSIALSPVLLGSALSWHSQAAFSLLTFIIILISALCIQIGTNLYNDAADFEKGADTPERLGPKRAAQQGWLNAGQIKRGALISFFMAFLAGIYLAYLGGMAIIILGLISILCGYAYTGGPKAIAYTPLGELFVIVFFGFAAVGGSFYLQSHTINYSVLILATGIGSMAAAILLVNNYRDLEGDRKVKKLTLVHYIGRPMARKLYVFMMSYPYLLLLVLLPQYPWTILLALFSLPLAIMLIGYFLRMEITSELNKVLAYTAQLQLLYTLLLSLGLWLSQGLWLPPSLWPS
ncbi:1,4-dihydroxy-2-naphthoate polyprenyltransferase [sulfur-oxidizing endosymbiont of Gigantopelta aegis]|uniref:1,4-dihydroxy-2-naphthoate polyprenyltransferase n=1 Tax=sulfur-oxidizing endosymbiont of Gigantopelta aegis TaxID=2794934 RepID=UPI0018DBAFF3|nr:1,4-dihydroxy-2-naphthoate polyprenyltransferase [sulfur-oxidizing endosymbiont of Gigantopelta aegis]